MSTAPQSPQQPEPQVEESRDQVRVRRAPKYPVFIFGGIIVGIIVTFIATALAPGSDDGTPFIQAFGYFALYGITIGACVGSLVAVLIDWISTRRSRTVDTQRLIVEGTDPDGADIDADSAVDGELEN